MNGSADPLHNETDYPRRRYDSPLNKSSKALGKERAGEEEQGPSSSEDEAEIARQEEKQRTSIEEHLKRLSIQERNRRASKRKHSPTVSIQPPLVDLSRRISRRASQRTKSLDSRKSSVDSSAPYSHTASNSLASNGLAEVVEEEELPSPSTARSDSSIKAARHGSKFVEELPDSPVMYTPDLSGTRPGFASSYSLQSMVNRSSGIYAHPAEGESTLYLTNESFGAGHRARTLSVTWYEAVFCCMCFGHSDEEQSGATMPS